jgi:carbonic anhydrase/acetyltransferase-like protein (isoleucine patch superfamily)
MTPRRKSLAALLFGFGAVVLAQSASFAIRPAEPRRDPMPKGEVFASHKTDFTPKPVTGTIAASSYLHPTAKVVGDVRIGGNVWIGPRASVRADLGHHIAIEEGSNIQDGVVIWGYATEAEGKKIPGRSVVPSEDPKAETVSVKIEKNVSILSQAQIVGPSLVGQDTFIGAGALVYQSTIGAGSVIEAGAQLLNVQVPPNSYVSAGKVVTRQDFADRLPQKTEEQSNPNRPMTELYARLTRGYLGTLDAGVSLQQKELWASARKEVLWMPSIPMLEHPDFASPTSDEKSTRNARAVTIGDVKLQNSFLAAGAILRADHGAKIEANRSWIFENAILVADLSAHVTPPAPASMPSSAPTSEPALDVAPTAPLPLPGRRPPIDTLRPNMTAPSNDPIIAPAPPPIDPTSAPTTEPTSAPASAPAPKEPGIFVGDHAIIEAGAVIYGSSTIGYEARIKSRAIIIASEIGEGTIVEEGAIVSHVYIPTGKIVASGKTISTQADADNLPSLSTRPEQATVMMTAPRHAVGPALIDPLSTIDLTMVGGTTLRTAKDVYVSDHTALIAMEEGTIDLQESSFVQSGATLLAKKDVVVSPGAIISAQAFVSDSNIEEGAFVGARAIVRDSIIEKNAVVEPGAIVINTMVPAGMFIPAGTVWTKGKASEPSESWKATQAELAFAGKSFAAVYAETARKAELRGANRPKKAAASGWGAYFTPEAILFALLIIVLLSVLGFGIKEVEK